MVTKTIPEGKKMQEGKLVVREGLQIAEKEEKRKANEKEQDMLN